MTFVDEVNQKLSLDKDFLYLYETVKLNSINFNRIYIDGGVSVKDANINFRNINSLVYSLLDRFSKTDIEKILLLRSGGIVLPENSPERNGYVARVANYVKCMLTLVACANGMVEYADNNGIIGAYGWINTYNPSYHTGYVVFQLKNTTTYLEFTLHHEIEKDLANFENMTTNKFMNDELYKTYIRDFFDGTPVLDPNDKNRKGLRQCKQTLSGWAQNCIQICKTL